MLLAKCSPAATKSAHKSELKRNPPGSQQGSGHSGQSIGSLQAPTHSCTPRPPQEKQDPLSHFQMDTLLMTTHNLLFGGTETVGTTMRHAFLILMKYPKVQGTAAAEAAPFPSPLLPPLPAPPVQGAQ